MNTMMIAFRIAEGPDYQVKRNRLHHAVMSFFGADKVFDELTSLYIVQSDAPAQNVASLFALQAGLTPSDKLLVLSGRIAQRGSYGVLQQIYKLLGTLTALPVAALFRQR